MAMHSLGSDRSLKSNFGPAAANKRYYGNGSSFLKDSNSKFPPETDLVLKNNGINVFCETLNTQDSNKKFNIPNRLDGKINIMESSNWRHRSAERDIINILSSNRRPSYSRSGIQEMAPNKEKINFYPTFNSNFKDLVSRCMSLPPDFKKNNCSMSSWKESPLNSRMHLTEIFTEKINNASKMADRGCVAKENGGYSSASFKKSFSAPRKDLEHCQSVEIYGGKARNYNNNTDGIVSKDMAIHEPSGDVSQCSTAVPERSFDDNTDTRRDSVNGESIDCVDFVDSEMCEVGSPQKVSRFLKVVRERRASAAAEEAKSKESNEAVIDEATDDVASRLEAKMLRTKMWLSAMKRIGQMDGDKQDDRLSEVPYVNDQMINKIDDLKEDNCTIAKYVNQQQLSNVNDQVLVVNDRIARDTLIEHDNHVAEVKNEDLCSEKNCIEDDIQNFKCDNGGSDDVKAVVEDGFCIGDVLKDVGGDEIFDKRSDFKTPCLIIVEQSEVNDCNVDLKGCVSPDSDSGVISMPELVEKFHIESHDDEAAVITDDKCVDEIKKDVESNVVESKMVKCDSNDNKCGVEEVEPVLSCEEKMAKIKAFLASRKAKRKGTFGSNEEQQLKLFDDVVPQEKIIAKIETNDNASKIIEVVEEKKEDDCHTGKNDRKKGKGRRSKKDKNHRLNSVKYDGTNAHLADVNSFPAERISPTKQNRVIHDKVHSKRHKNEHSGKKHRHKERENVKRCVVEDMNNDSDKDDLLYFTPETLKLERRKKPNKITIQHLAKENETEDNNQPSCSSKLSKTIEKCANLIGGFSGQFSPKSILCKETRIRDGPTRCSISSVDSADCADFDEIKGRFKKHESECQSDDSFVIVFEDPKVIKINKTNVDKNIDVNKESKRGVVIEDSAAKQSRTRFPSECESEDSFVVIFEPGSDSSTEECYGHDDVYSASDTDGSSDDDDDSNSSGYGERCSSGDEDDDDERTEFVEEVPKLKGCLKKRRRSPKPDDSEEETVEKTVRFDEAEPVIHEMTEWDEATLREARMGPWEQFVRDGERFRQRIRDASPALDWVLRREHRAVVFFQRFRPILMRAIREEKAAKAKAA